MFRFSTVRNIQIERLIKGFRNYFHENRAERVLFAGRDNIRSKAARLIIQSGNTSFGLLPTRCNSFGDDAGGGRVSEAFSLQFSKWRKDLFENYSGKCHRANANKKLRRTSAATNTSTKYGNEEIRNGEGPDSGTRSTATHSSLQIFIFPLWYEGTCILKSSRVTGNGKSESFNSPSSRWNSLDHRWAVLRVAKSNANILAHSSVV